VQQDFYEKELSGQRDQIKRMIDPTPHETLQDQLTDKDNLNLAVKTTLDLRRKLGEASVDRDEMMKQISLLNDELKIQEQHFQKELALKNLELQEIKKNSLSKDSELLQKLKELSESNNNNDQ
jgi:hypothetical protein